MYSRTSHKKDGSKPLEGGAGKGVPNHAIEKKAPEKSTPTQKMNGMAPANQRHTGRMGMEQRANSYMKAESQKKSSANDHDADDK